MASATPLHRPPLHTRAGLVVLVAVSLLHLWLLGGGFDPAAGFGTRDPVPQRAPLLVRSIAAPAAPAAPVPVPVVAATPPSARAALSVARKAAPVAMPASTAEPTEPALPVPDRPTEPAAPNVAASSPEPSAAADAPAAIAATAATPVPEASPVPVFATRLAAAFRRAYELRRGALTGSAELTWQPAADGYQLELRGSVMGVDAIGLASRGGFDRAGIAPERFVDRRRGRDRHAASFDRAAGRITFSGPQISHPLVDGTQDRLSWMLQLPAIIEAEPGRFGPGAKVPIAVAGSRGDHDVWVFVVHGIDAVDLPDGSRRNALRVTREPRKPYDTQVEIWLDTAEHHLPLKAVLTTLPGGASLEMLLRPAPP